jgi:hypothetical protein
MKSFGETPIGLLYLGNHHEYLALVVGRLPRRCPLTSRARVFIGPLFRSEARGDV